MASTSAGTEKSPTTTQQKAEPAVLGVNIPINVTVSAAKQVGAAWQKFGMDLLEAVKHAREAKAKSSPPKDKQSSVSESGASPTASA